MILSCKNYCPNGSIVDATITLVEDFGAKVRTARVGRGWTQRDLAQRAGVSQRAVSSWERAVSEPDRDVQQRVAAILQLPDMPRPAQATLMQSASQHPGRARLSELPLHLLSSAEFEDFAVALAGALRRPDGLARRLGATGHKQFGFDVVVEKDGTVTDAIQCKRVARFGPGDVDDAIAKASMKARRRYIFLSRIASPAAADAARRHRGWQLWDRNTLSHQVHGLPLSDKLQIVDRFFPQLREDFLGVRLPSLWLDPADYFARTARSERYSHRWPLVGRDELLKQVAAFAASPGGVGMLVGRGGIGKSKLLYDVCARLADQRDLTVRVLAHDGDLDGRAFEHLPTGRLLVIIDDAHDEDAALSRIVEGVYVANQQATVLLALRPYGEPHARRQLREAGIPANTVFRRDLDDLTVADAEILAICVLGPACARFAPRLAHAARDCPLLLVSGAELIKQGTLDPDQLEGDTRLRRELTDALAAASTADAAAHSEVRSEVLKAVAALQPMRLNKPEFRDALEELTCRPFDQVSSHLAALEEAGVLLRRGAALRVVPDLLGDALLARAARSGAWGMPTGYLDRVLRAASGSALAHLIVNSGRMDWQERAARPDGLLDRLWAEVGAQFRAGDAAERSGMLGVLASVAFFQPTACLDLVRWALDHPAEPQDLHTDQEVRDAAGLVLRAAAYDKACFAQAADLLWRMAAHDTRSPAQHPHHPLRMLADLAEYDRA